MLSHLIAILFLVGAIIATRIDRIYVIPFVMLFFTNINGLVAEEDFAFHGIIKFKDHGLIIVIFLLIVGAFRHKEETSSYLGGSASRLFLKIINFLWIYYLGLLVYSIIIQANFIWPIKMARTYFYGIIFYLCLKLLLIDPIPKFEKLIKLLAGTTLLFAFLYILHNLTKLNIYPAGDYEVFTVKGAGEFARNFSGYPVFTIYFFIYFIDGLIEGRGNKWINVISIILLMICMVLQMTRGLIVIALIMVIFMIFYNIISPSRSFKSITLVAGAFVVITITPYMIPGQYSILFKKMSSLMITGIGGSGTFRDRSDEFFYILKSVMHFNPIFGFGFTNVKIMGFHSNILTMGSPDNALSNLIGMTGFLGTMIYFLMFTAWFFINRKLRMLRAEPFSRVHFFYLLFLIGLIPGSDYTSHIEYFCLFMAYDLVSYAWLNNQREQSIFAKQ